MSRQEPQADSGSWKLLISRSNIDVVVGVLSNCMCSFPQRIWWKLVKFIAKYLRLIPFSTYHNWPFFNNWCRMQGTHE